MFFISIFDLALSISFWMGFCLLCQLTIVSAPLLCFPDRLALTDENKKRNYRLPLASVNVWKEVLFNCHLENGWELSRYTGGRVYVKAIMVHGHLSWKNGHPENHKESGLSAIIWSWEEKKWTLWGEGTLYQSHQSSMLPSKFGACTFT